jgi:hypothetical protein
MVKRSAIRREEEKCLLLTSEARRSESAFCLSALTLRSSASLARFASISARRLSDIEFGDDGNGPVTGVHICALVHDTV